MADNFVSTSYFGYDIIMRLPNNPTIYEIHTAAYLNELAVRDQTRVYLDTIPDDELNRLMTLGIDAVWLMGVWQRSAAAVAVDMANEGLQAEFRAVLPDFTPEDVIGSAYAVQDYTVDARFGGDDALARLRERLSHRGIGLILDFVPNHTSPDHAWAREHVDYYIHSDSNAALREPDVYAAVGDHSIAMGRDPNSAPWPDVLQMNAFSPGYRKATVDTLGRIASMSDGVRCDMAMLMLDNVVQRTWGQLAGEPLATTYWQDATHAVREQHPDFTFIAECYWDTERTLIEQGFDYCYDKTLYDYLVANDPAGACDYLARTADIQSHMLHFVENHDEPRAAARLPLDQSMAAGAITATLPGASLLHHGQVEGKQIKIPVQLGRGAHELPCSATRDFYGKLYAWLKESNIRDGTWSPRATQDSAIITYELQHEHTVAMLLVNYSETRTTIDLPIPIANYSDVLADNDGTPIIVQAAADKQLQLGPWQTRLLVYDQSAVS